MSIDDEVIKEIEKHTKDFKRTCYDCERMSFCALYRDTQELIKKNIDWFDVDMAEPNWQRLLESIGSACIKYKKR